MSTDKIKRVALRQQSNYESIAPNFIIYDPETTISDLRLYMIINSFRINHKPCCASLKWISEQMGTCEREIQRSRKKLVEKGYILHYRKANKWYFQIPMPEICTDIEDSGVTDYDTSGVTDYDTSGVTDYDTHNI